MINGLSREVVRRLGELLSFCIKGDAEHAAELLLSDYLTVENAMSADVDELAKLVGRDAAVMLKVACAVASRRGTDSFKFGEVHTDGEICDYFKALYLGAPVEKVYVMNFDGVGRALCCDFIASGTVNSSEILPRKILESALRAKAESVVIAHNHPRGFAKPSREDLIQTASLYNILSTVGIKLKYHCVVASSEVAMLQGNADFSIL